jgi:hypothetical protein
MNNNTVLAIAFLIAGTLLTTTVLTTMVPSAYADNKQKAEDDSAAAIADCDDNEVEEARFLCIALATNDVEIETSEEEPPEESATLFVCKEVEGNQELGPFNFEFSATGPDVGIQFPGVPENERGNDCPPGSQRPGEVAPGEYVIRELITSTTLSQPPDSIEVEGDCTQIDPPDEQTLAAATVEIQEGDLGETLICTFTNIYEGGDS